MFCHKKRKRVTERKLLSLVWVPNYFIAPTHEQTVYFWKLTACSVNSYWTSGMGTDNLPKRPEGKWNEACLFLSTSTANAFYFQYFLPGVCFICFCFLLRTCCQKDCGLIVEADRNLTPVLDNLSKRREWSVSDKWDYTIKHITNGLVFFCASL